MNRNCRNRNPKRIVEKGSYTEKDASALICQILDPVDYMHCQSDVHVEIRKSHQ
uniref:Uncharacterized protein n=1 Tax=Tetranychus urticae TaxID=32264 RepID=T1JXR3_TETUR